ncbi:MAG: homogentisate 1,2-dioxygenase [Myxococcales bacterium]|nr:homogentisate 1,2-dioxygenase [Myxococcales bacterium]
MIERRVAGEVPRKHHIQFRGPEGALRHEECLTREGFDGPYSILYHTHRPHAARLVGPTERGRLSRVAAQPEALARRHYKTGEVAAGPSPLDARVPLFFNDDVTLTVLKPSAPDTVYFANGDGDDLFFIFEGGGVLESVVGDVRFDKDDYLFIPKGLLHRIVPDPGVAQHWFGVEMHAGLHVPRQWRNDVGQLKMDAPYCHRDFRGPVFRGPTDVGIREVVARREGRATAYAYAESPFDVVGWDGAVYPWAFSILDFQPRVSSIHLPPTWHGTFATRGALLCSFVPRVVDFHPQAIPCPYPHSSVDCDEILFYCRGNFTSRRGVGPGSISFHPMGVMHGPHPGAYEASVGHRETTELAVMLDTFKPLRPTAEAAALEAAGYHDTFL